MDDRYIFEQIINLASFEIRRINPFGEIVKVYGNTSVQYDPFQKDNDFFNTVLNRSSKPFPDVFCEENYIYYCLISLENKSKILMGPVQIIDEYDFLTRFMVKTHKLLDDGSYKIPYCDLNVFLKIILLLNHFLTGQQIYLNELCKCNGISEQEVKSAKNEINNI